MKTPIAITNHAKNISKRLAKSSEKLAKLYENCFVSTADTALKELEDGSLFVLTGDIPAMWLRDSSAQVNHYVQLADDPEVASLIKGVISKQLDFILMDPYANAFYKESNKRGEWASDITNMKPGVHERKWEIDSHCYPIRLAYEYWKVSADTSIFSED